MYMTYCSVFMSEHRCLCIISLMLLHMCSFLVAEDVKTLLYRDGGKLWPCHLANFNKIPQKEANVPFMPPFTAAQRLACLLVRRMCVCMRVMWILCVGAVCVRLLSNVASVAAHGSDSHAAPLLFVLLYETGLPLCLARSLIPARLIGSEAKSPSHPSPLLQTSLLSLAL